MPPEELVSHLQLRPFVSFRLHLSDGSAFEIRHPEMLMVTRRTASVGIPGEAGSMPFDHNVTVSLVHITRLEPIDSSAVAG